MVDVETTIELTDAQRAVLVELVHLHAQRDGTPVKGKEIAAGLDRNPGTIRTQMQSLKSLGLVTGIPGPKGGYEPTARAHELVDEVEAGPSAPVPLQREGEPVTDATVTELDFFNLHLPDGDEAEVYVDGSVRSVNPGDQVTIGPTPSSRIEVAGTVRDVDPVGELFVLGIEDVGLAES